jgi:RND family efflux transporter MFP subunit
MSRTLKHKQYIAIIIVAILSLTACTQESPKKDASFSREVSARIETPKLRTVTQWEEFTGRFQAKNRVEVRSRVAGYLHDIHFEDGQIVQQGDLLFVIDQRPYQIALNKMKASFKLANSEYKRAKGLLSSKAISKEDFEQRMQEQQLALSDLNEAKLNMEFTQITAPFTGRVSRNLVDVGALIRGGDDSATILTTLISINPIEFYFEASETNLLNYMRAREKGLVSDDRRQPHPVFVKLKDEDNFEHRGVIDFVDNELDSDTSTIQVRAVFQNEKGLLESGLFARLRVAWTKASEMIVVPAHVIGTEQTRKYVYALDDNNKAIRKYVTLGPLSDDGVRVIQKGLSIKDRIIVGNLHKIQPNRLVTPIEGNVLDKEQGVQ